MITEVSLRRAKREHSQNIDASMKGAGSILTIDNQKELPEMTIKLFLSLTKHGKSLSIFDGYVIDIERFMVS